MTPANSHNERGHHVRHEESEQAETVGGSRAGSGKGLVERAGKQSASEPEIAENVLAAAALHAGGAITHGTHAMMGI